MCPLLVSVLAVAATLLVHVGPVLELLGDAAEVHDDDDDDET